VIQYEEQTTAEWQELTAYSEANIRRWKQQKLELIPALCEKYHLYRFNSIPQ
jgi:hypothetical protein